jgi:hypothetical protein
MSGNVGFVSVLYKFHSPFEPELQNMLKLGILKSKQLLSYRLQQILRNTSQRGYGSIVLCAECNTNQSKNI